MLGGVCFHISRKDRQLDGQRIPYPQQDACYISGINPINLPSPVYHAGG